MSRHAAAIGNLRFEIREINEHIGKVARWAEAGTIAGEIVDEELEFYRDLKVKLMASIKVLEDDDA